MSDREMAMRKQEQPTPVDPPEWFRELITPLEEWPRAVTCNSPSDSESSLPASEEDRRPSWTIQDKQ